MTDRQYVAWREWCRDDLETPDKHLWAIYQLTEVTSRIDSTSGLSLDANRWKMKFLRDRQEEIREETPDERELRYAEQQVMCSAMAGKTSQALMNRIQVLRAKVAEEDERREKVGGR